jgi:hypothetical protein
VAFFAVCDGNLITEQQQFSGRRLLRWSSKHWEGLHDGRASDSEVTEHQ